jgi:ADP-heptose:LPS heptosyltransferase
VTRLVFGLPASNARIAVVRFGDPTSLLAAIPALRAIRAGFPQAHVTLVTSEAVAELTRRFPSYIDATAPPHAAATESFDLTIELQQPTPQSQAAVANLRSHYVAGFTNGAPNGTMNGTQRRIEWPQQGSEVLRLLMLVRELGLRDQGEALEFPYTAADRAELEACRDVWSLLGGPFVCIQPGARDSEKRWPVARYARVADALAGHGLRIALTGTAADRPIAAAVAARMRARPIDLSGCLTLGAFAVLLDYTYLLVCGDTGVTRLAEAIGTPSVTIAGGSDIALWRPLDRVRNRVLWLPGTERPSAERLYSQWGDNSGIPLQDVLEPYDVLLAQPALKQRAAVRAYLARLRHESRLTRQPALSLQPRTEAPMVRRAS